MHGTTTTVKSFAEERSVLAMVMNQHVTTLSELQTKMEAN